MNTPTPQEPPRGRTRRPPRRVQVVRVATLSPRMRRITVQGEALADFPAFLPAAYIKLIFPEAGQSEPPAMTPDGPRPATMRTYTPRFFRPEQLEMDIDFVLHGAGVAATWAAQAAPGQPLLLMGPGPGYEPDATASRFLLVGDASALPALEMVAAALPAGAQLKLVVEVPDLQEARDLPGIAAADVQWVARGADRNEAGRALEAALQAAGAAQPDTRAYVACEAIAMRRLRAWLLAEGGIARQHLVGRGYWRLGTVNHPDHDYGDDPAA